MFGILNTTLRIATRMDASPDSTRRTTPGKTDSTLRPRRAAPNHSAHHPRFGLRPGESWNND